jgi:hypothetical protein
MQGWIHDAPPPEWKEGMMLVVENERGGMFIDVIGGCTLIAPSYNEEGYVPGSESDYEGLHIDRWPWIGDGPIPQYTWTPCIRAWHPGVSAHIHPIDSLPWLHDAEVLP